MNRLEYLESHHQLTQSIVGLVSIQDSLEGVQAVLDKWKPMLNDLSVQRYKTVCTEQGIDWEDIKQFMGFSKVVE
jgi:hypothetical protein